MEKRQLALIAFFLILSIGNYMRLTGNETVRNIQFLSIFTIGAFSALLLVRIITLLKRKKDRSSSV